MEILTKRGEPIPQRIAILRALHLGDLLCSVPALRALRSALPNAQITLIGLPWAQEFVHRFSHYIDDLTILPGFPGLPERQPQISQIPRFLEEMQWLKYDLLLQMQGSGNITNLIASMMGSRSTAGFFLPGQFCPDESLFIPYPVHESEVRKHLNLINHLGIPSQGEHLEFPMFVEDWEEFHHLVNKFRLKTGQYAVLHPGARAVERRWPINNFAQVAEGLFERGLQVVLTGTESEASLTADLAAQTHIPVINLAGKTSLGSMAALLARARLLISNDTGVSHLAAALQIPSIILFMASDPQRWAPLNKKLHRVIAWASAANPELVLDEANQLLSEERAYAS
jgi:ADP-heptose:LPS heptosyltransferase